MRQPFFLLLLLPLTACASVDDDGDRFSRRRVKIEAFHQTVEYGELEFDPDDGPSVDVRDLERERTGVRATYGSRKASSYVQVFAEEFDDPAFPTDTIDGFGFGLGAVGTLPIHRLGEDTYLVIPYRGATSVAFGGGDQGALDSDLAYLEFEGEVGFGVSINGLQATLGFHGTSLNGVLDTEGVLVGETTDFSGSNAAGFVELGYDEASAPITARLRATFGDVEVLEVSVGFVL